MTASELKYSIAAKQPNERGDGAKMAAIAVRSGVSKVSVYPSGRAFDRKRTLLPKRQKSTFDRKGAAEIADYLTVMDFIGYKLQRHCDTPKEKAFDEAIGAACALGEESRNKVLALAKGRVDG